MRSPQRFIKKNAIFVAVVSLAKALIKQSLHQTYEDQNMTIAINSIFKSKS